ncbi:hypothetical protein ACFUTV_43645 [Streptomyces sp. NPDC057298]|uniref:hypothetical protein n=1 Tax=Streptomyces sp. NPDC057298 TaxID=3346091 RepID=UPI003625F174
MDYLVSVFKHLTEGSVPPGARDLKYTVLHLQAATEVLLKARLLVEHFSLVFADPAKATREAWEKGTFVSCTTLEAIERLGNIAGIVVTEGAKRDIKKLAEARNALQHFGLTQTAYAIEAGAARVLNFLLPFIHLHLVPRLEEAQQVGVERTMDSLRLKLVGIQSLVTARMKSLRAELDPRREATVECPDCRQWAMVADGAKDGPTCRFCHQAWGGATSAAANYAFIVLGQLEWLEVAHGGQPPVRDCPECGDTALVLDAVTAASKPAAQPLCFGCATHFADLRECEGGCGNVVSGDSEQLLCTDCVDTFSRNF